MLSNQERQFLSLAYLDLATTQLMYLSDISWDIEHLAVTQNGRRMALVTNTDGYSLLEIFDVSNGWEARQPLLTPTLPGGVVAEIVWSHGRTRLALTFVTPDDALDGACKFPFSTISHAVTRLLPSFQW